MRFKTINVPRNYFQGNWHHTALQDLDDIVEYAKEGDVMDSLPLFDKRMPTETVLYKILSEWDKKAKQLDEQATVNLTLNEYPTDKIRIEFPCPIEPYQFLEYSFLEPLSKKTPAGARLIAEAIAVCIEACNFPKPDEIYFEISELIPVYPEKRGEIWKIEKWRNILAEMITEFTSDMVYKDLVKFKRYSRYVNKDVVTDMVEKLLFLADGALTTCVSADPEFCTPMDTCGFLWEGTIDDFSYYNESNPDPVRNFGVDRLIGNFFSGNNCNEIGGNYSPFHEYGIPMYKELKQAIIDFGKIAEEWKTMILYLQ